MTTVVKGKLVRADVAFYDGVESLVSRRDSTGGRISSLPINDFIDVLQVYGGGTAYTRTAIQDAVNKIGTRNRTLRFNPGTWTIDDNLTIPSNLTSYVPAGCVFDVASGKTLTFSGPLIRDSDTWTSGSGTVTANKFFVQLADTTSTALGDALVGGKRSETGAVAFTGHEYNQGRALNLKVDFDAAGDGTTDDTTAVTAADAVSGPKFVPPGTYDTTLAATDLDGPYWGFGQIRDTSNNNRAPYFVAVKAAPSSEGNHNSINTAFNGDISKSLFQVECRITGSTTLGQPTGAGTYKYTPEVYPFRGYLYNESGYNESTSGGIDAGGRTAAVFSRVSVFQAGQGDAVAYNASGIVTSARSGATAWPANPAIVLFNGNVTAGVDGCYLNPVEILAQDNGFDCACVVGVFRGDRTVNTAALGEIWVGLRAQSEGSAAMDVAYSASGPFTYGLDLTKATLGSDKGGVLLKEGDRIYFRATGGTYIANAVGNTYIEYTTGISALNFIVGSASILQLSASQVASTKHVNLASGQEYRINSTKVVGARQTGFTTAAGTANKDASGINVGTITATDANLQAVAAWVKAIHDALATHGLIGA